MRRELLMQFMTMLLLFDFVHLHNPNPLALLVSFDGFRYDYIEKTRQSGRKTPNFDRLRNSGVEAEHIRNTYPTETFTNHFSLVTGHHGESHGVIANEFLDPISNKIFNYHFENSSDPLLWNNGSSPTGKGNGGAEPIWVTNQKADPSGSRRSGVLYWPGADVELHGTLANFFEPYNENLPDKPRVDTMVKWFTDKENPINLGVLYFPEPDLFGHKVGPEADELYDLIVKLDSSLGYLIEQLGKVGLMDDMNIIITSDHGMAPLKEDNLIVLDQYLDSRLYTHLSEGSKCLIIPIEGQLDIVYNFMSVIPNTKVYKKEEIPRQFFYTWNIRIPPIILVAEEGYIIRRSIPEKAGGNKGTHGYSNDLISMHPFFIAHGPAFKRKFTSGPFNNIDIYPLLCNILGIEPYPNNGSLDNVIHILKEKDDSSVGVTIVTLLTVAVIAASVSGFLCLAVMRGDHTRQHRPLVVRMDNAVSDRHSLLHGSSEGIEEEAEDEIP